MWTLKRFAGNTRLQMAKRPFAFFCTNSWHRSWRLMKRKVELFRPDFYWGTTRECCCDNQILLPNLQVHPMRWSPCRIWPSSAAVNGTLCTVCASCSVVQDANALALYAKYLRIVFKMLKKHAKLFAFFMTLSICVFWVPLFAYTL